MASNPKGKPECVARVQVTLEIGAGSVWGDECSIGQVFDQAAIETVDRMRNLLRPLDVKVVGEPVVTAIMAKR